MNSAFDQAAIGYDTNFTFSQIGKAQREIVHKYLDEIFPGNKQINILELNCGTGEDAIYFAKRGYSVLATDISINMLNVARQKVESENLNNNIKLRQMDILKIRDENFEHKFDLIFSNFGGLNCIDSSGLEKFSYSIKKHLNKSGRLIFVIMSDYCIWEKIYFLIKLNFKESKRRKNKSGVKANLDGSNVRTYYYSPREIEKVFNHSFNLISKKPVGFFIPPSYLNKSFSQRPKAFNFLKKLESTFYKYSFLSSFSDHFIIDLCLK